MPPTAAGAVDGAVAGKPGGGGEDQGGQVVRLHPGIVLTEIDAGALCLFHQKLAGFVHQFGFGREGQGSQTFEFSVKVSVATTLNRCKGGQFAVHAQALPGRPFDGHTLETVIPAIETLTGATLKRILGDAGYRGHNAPGIDKLRAFTAGQKRCVTLAINPFLAAAGYNFHLILKWIRLLFVWFRIAANDNDQLRTTLGAA